MSERTLFDSTDDDRGAAAEGQEGPASHLPRPCVGRAIASSVESNGGAPCQDGAGESPAHPDGPLDTSHDDRSGPAWQPSHDDRPSRPTDSLWRECPLEQFMAMTEQEQLDYCARRDEDSARFANDETDSAFYLDRAAWYRRRMEEI